MTQPGPTKPSNLPQAWRWAGHPLFLCLLLASATLLAYWPVIHADFINFDDPDYVTENPRVQSGLTWENAAWAFRTSHASNWHPLTWLSHMLDVQLFGKGAMGPHCVNLGLHLMNALLLFLLLRRATGAHWKSFLVVGLFALHPLHVESVAWIAERKDVLSTLFWMLTLLAYVGYVEASRVQQPKAKVCYGLALTSFALGLLSKPMLVTLPFVMLLLDFWPLQRLPPTSSIWQGLLRLLVQEKWPFLLLSAMACVVTLWAQQGAMQPIAVLPLEARVANSLVSYVRYLGKMFWPTNLALPYPHPGQWPDLHVMLAAILLAVLVIATVKARGKLPFALTGWFWFLGTLIPVIGLVQVGSQAMGDRYTYIPLIGVFIMMVWGAEVITRWRLPLFIFGCVSAASLIGCGLLTRKQVGYWQDSEQLFRHSVAVTENNCVALDNLGVALELKGDPHAIEWYQRALQVDPNHPDTLFNMGNALAGGGQCSEAIPFLEAALRFRPNNHRARNNLANALAKLGRNDEAVTQYQLALQFEPSDPKIHKNIATILTSSGRLDEAVAHYRRALQLAPDDSSTHYGLGLAVALSGRWDEAIKHYTASLHLLPGNPEAQYNLGYALRVQGNFEEATTHFNEALRLKPEFALAHFNLGATLEAQGLRDRAILHLQEAIRINPDYTEAKALLHSLTAD